MRDPYPLRPISDDEFKTWAHMIANTYGQDRRDADLEHERSTIELERTIAAFDGDSPVAGAAIYTRSMTIPGAVQPIAGVTWVGVSPTHRRRGILTSMMRKRNCDPVQWPPARSPFAASGSRSAPPVESSQRIELADDALSNFHPLGRDSRWPSSLRLRRGQARWSARCL